jgi:NADPH:quinone reductase-like Zn-dependent oxidoreductase
VRAAGVRHLGDAVEVFDLPDPRGLRAGEILLEVRAAGVGNWDEFIRTGSWDTGPRPPMALGVAAAGYVTATGSPDGGGGDGGGDDGFGAGDRVTTHSVPLPEQGCWAEWLIVPVEHCAILPHGVSFDIGAALAVPALTADQVVTEALLTGPGQTVLVHGAGGVTGGMLVQLAAYRGATVIAAAGPGSAERIKARGAAHVLDYHQPGWPGQVRLLTGGGVDAAANAALSGAADAVQAVRDGGRLATITVGLPAAQRAITMLYVQVMPDGRRLGELARLAAEGVLTVAAVTPYPLDQAAAALAQARHGAHGAAVVLRPDRDEDGA